jgi:hypothetical protein
MSRTVAELRSTPSRTIDPPSSERSPVSASTELGLSVALNTGNGQNLPGAYVETHALDRGEALVVTDRHVLNDQCHVAGIGRLLLDGQVNAATDHH